MYLYAFPVFHPQYISETPLFKFQPGKKFAVAAVDLHLKDIFARGCIHQAGTETFEEHPGKDHLEVTFVPSKS